MRVNEVLEDRLSRPSYPQSFPHTHARARARTHAHIERERERDLLKVPVLLLTCKQGFHCLLLACLAASSSHLDL